MNQLLGPSHDQMARMRENILTSAPKARTKARRKVLLTASITFAAFATAAAAIAVPLATVGQQNTSVDCYRVADLGAPHGTAELGDGSGSGTVLQPISERIRNALEVCAADAAAVATDRKLRTSTVSVTNPTVCQLGDRRLAVFPNIHDVATAEFCSDLGADTPTL